MPTIITQPSASANLFRAYQPLIFTLSETTIYALPPIIKAQLTINGVVYPFDEKQFLTQSGGTYYFEFNPAPLIQEFFENESTFSGYAASAANLAVPAASSYNQQYLQQCEWYIFFYTWEASGVNGEYVFSNSVASTTNYALNARANQDSISDLTPFVTLPLKFMTNANKKRIVCLEDSAFLSFFNTGFGKDFAVRVRTYNSAGVLQQTGYIKVGNVAPELRVERIKTGAANINATLSAAWVGAATAYITANITRYEIDMWDLVLLLPQSETRTYYIQDSCCQEYQVWFLDEFGNDDFVYAYRGATAYKSVGETFERFNNNFPKSSARGSVSLREISQTQIDLFVRPESQNSMNWLKELINSPNIFLLPKGDTKLIAVQIADSSGFLIAEKKKNVREIPISFTFANKDLSQRN